MPKRSWRDRNWCSTLEAAKILGLCHMTVIRRFDSGDLDGYRVPGSRFRRIPKASLRQYAEQNQIPYNEELLTAASKPGTSRERPLVPASSSSENRTALIVEDDPNMADLMEKILSSDGWEVSLARNGFDAGFMAGSLRPKIILLDIMLPGLDGRDACRRMRRDPRLADTRIMAVTSLSDQKSIDEIFDAGADAYLAKPFSLKALREAISSLLTASCDTGKSAQGVNAEGASTDKL